MSLAWTAEASRRGGPLEGVRVIELTKVWAGPFAGKQLGFLGAEVIRVESLGSLDTARSYNVQDLDNAPGFQAVNPQKLGVQIDMKSPEGRALLLRLLAGADIVVENMRPGATERLGLGYEDVRKTKPDIIYVAMSMYGNDGPLAYQTGYAPCFAALGGISALVGYEGEAPTGMNIRHGDSTFGTAAAFAATVALVHRKRTGEGQFIDVSAVEVLSSMIGDAIIDYTVNGAIHRCDGNDHSDLAPHGFYRCQGDLSWLSIAVRGDEQWRTLVDAIGDPELAADPRFLTHDDRVAHRDELDARIGRWTATEDAAALATRLQQLGLAAERSWNSIELSTDADLWADQFYPVVIDCRDQRRAIVGPSWKMTGGAALTRGSPAIGQDNSYVLGDILGLSEAEQRRLAAEGVTR